MSLEDFSPSTNVLRDDKLEKINERIKVIETTIRDLLDSIHSKTRARELTDWNRSYSVYREKVRDTEYEVPLSQAYQQYQTLNEIMTSVERIANSSFRNLGELDALFFELTNLKERNQEEFGSTIDLIIRPGKERLDSRLQDQQNQACQMLEGLEDQFSRGAPLLKLNTTLEIMPPFLSEECQPRWHDLKQRVQQKLESSLVSEIVERFKQIHDPEIKIECIRQLHDLFEK